MQVETLIDRALVRFHTKRALGNALGVSGERVGDWHRGTRPCPLERQVLLCSLADLDDAATLAHVREAAGLPEKKNLCATVTYALSMVSGAALAAWHFGSLTTMYIM